MQKPIKARLLIAYGSCSVFICTIEPQEVCCPFYLGIGSYLFTFCVLIQTYPSFKNAVVSTNTQVWFFSHTLYKWDASPLLFIFLKTFRVVTHCVIDATFKIISSARALSSSRSENYCFSNCACETDCHLNLVTELRSETGGKKRKHYEFLHGYTAWHVRSSYWGQMLRSEQQYWTFGLFVVVVFMQWGSK